LHFDKFIKKLPNKGKTWRLARPKSGALKRPGQKNEEEGAKGRLKVGMID